MGLSRNSTRSPSELAFDARLREMLAMALVGGGVACSVFWSHVFFGPMLLSAVGVPVLAWLLPFLFPLVFCLLAFGVYSLTRWQKGKGLVPQKKRWDALFSKHTLMMACYGTAFALALSCASKIGAAGLAMGALWIPVLVMVAVYGLSQLVYSVWRHRYYKRLQGGDVAEKKQALLDARASASMLFVGSLFNLAAYFSMTMVAPSVVALTGVSAMAWVMPVLVPLALSALMGFAYHLYYLHQFKRGGQLKNNNRLAVIKNQPHFTGMVILGLLMPLGMMGAKILCHSLLAYSGSMAVSALMACLLPVTMALAVAGVGFMVYFRFESHRSHPIEMKIQLHTGSLVSALRADGPSGASPEIKPLTAAEPRPVDLVQINHLRLG